MLRVGRWRRADGGAASVLTGSKCGVAAAAGKTAAAQRRARLSFATRYAYHAAAASSTAQVA